MVATSVNPYLRKYFTDGENILFWNFADIDNLNDRIVELLQNPTKLKKMAQRGRDVVMQHMTWDRRIEDLMLELEPVFEQFKQEA